jgi:hypothetical protein
MCGEGYDRAVKICPGGVLVEAQSRAKTSYTKLRVSFERRVEDN